MRGIYYDIIPLMSLPSSGVRRWIVINIARSKAIYFAIIKLEIILNTESIKEHNRE